MYEYVTLSLNLREEHRLKVFQIRLLKRIFGPDKNKGTTRWRKLHNVELHNLNSSPNVITVSTSRTR
jgi:hypothetical protein